MMKGMASFLVISGILLAVFGFFSLSSNTNNEANNYDHLTNQKEKDWFSPRKWLTDQEIDWAVAKFTKNDKYKILPAHRFYYVKETKGNNEANAYLAFPELLNELTSFKGELVFIPVNNPDFHWSLLVYQVKNQKFWHYDTLRGANYNYVEPLVKELLSQIQQTNQPNLIEYLLQQHNIKQGNSYDCGVSVITITRRIITLATKQSWMYKLKYGAFQLGDDLGKFDFLKERERLRAEYLTENGEK